MKTSYSLADAVAVADTTTPTVKAWVRNKVVIADASEGSGPRKHHRFSVRGLVAVRLVSLLHAFDLPPAVLHAVTIAFFNADAILDREAPEKLDMWYRLLDRKRRTPKDSAFIVISKTFPGGVRLHIGGAAAPMPTGGDAWITVKVREAIEAVEGFTGDDIVSNAHALAREAKKGRS